VPERLHQVGVFGQIHLVGGAVPVDDEAVFVFNLLQHAEHVAHGAAVVEIAGRHGFAFAVGDHKRGAELIKMYLKKDFGVSFGRFLLKSCAFELIETEWRLLHWPARLL
jgi:hypothetical protein